MSALEDSQDTVALEKDPDIATPEGTAASEEIKSTVSGEAIADSEKHDEPQGKEEPPPPPNGGYGWVCTACCALINGHTWGLNSSYGVFLAHYLATDTFPGATSLEFAFVGGLSISCAMLISYCCPHAFVCMKFVC